MTGNDLKAARERLGLSRKELAEALNQALDRKYTDESVGKWERAGDDRDVPKAIGSFMEQVTLAHALGDDAMPGSDQRDDEPIPAGLPGDDTPPPPPVGGGPSIPSTSGAYARVCQEIIEIIATGVATTGAGIGSPKVVRDGEIIYNDAAKLGAAYGKLAEQNETFRRWLLQASMGGAWVQVALATGATTAAIVRNHQESFDVPAAPAPEPASDELRDAAAA